MTPKSDCILHPVDFLRVHQICMECGERYFHAKTLDEVDTYLLSKHAVKAQISVEIVNFAQAST